MRRKISLDSTMATRLAALGWAMANAKIRLGSPSAPPAEGARLGDTQTRKLLSLSWKRNGGMGDDDDVHCLQIYFDALVGLT